MKTKSNVLTSEQANQAFELLKSTLPLQSEAMESIRGHVIAHVTTTNPPPTDSKTVLKAYNQISGVLADKRKDFQRIENAELSSDECFDAIVLALADTAFFILSLVDVYEAANKKFKFHVPPRAARESKGAMETFKDDVKAYKLARARKNSEEAAVYYIKIAESIVKVTFSLIMHVVKQLIEEVLSSDSWFERIKEAVIIFAQIAIWFGSEGLALIGKILLSADACINTIDAWENIPAACSFDNFITTLEKNNGEVTVDTRVILHQKFNPAVSIFNENIYRFHFLTGNTIVYQTTTASELSELVSQNAQFKKNLKNIDYSDISVSEDATSAGNSDSFTNAIAAKVTDATKIKSGKYDKTFWTPPTPIVANGVSISKNQSTPATAVIGNRLYVCYQGLEKNSLMYITYLENGTWNTPVPIPSAYTTLTAPALVNCNNQLYVFFQGTTNQKIWFARLYDENGNFVAPSEPSSLSDVITTAATPKVFVYNNNMVVLFRSSGKSTFYWMSVSSDFGSTWSGPTQLPATVNSFGTPDVLIEDDKGLATIFYGGTESPAHIWKYELPLAAITTIGNWSSEVQNEFNTPPQPLNYNTDNEPITSVSAPVVMQTSDGNFLTISASPNDFKVVSFNEFS